jgi:polyphosphate kinase
VAYLHDDCDAWDLMEDGKYRRVQCAGDLKCQGAQAALMARHAAREGAIAEGAWT